MAGDRSSDRAVGVPRRVARAFSRRHPVATICRIAAVVAAVVAIGVGDGGTASAQDDEVVVAAFEVDPFVVRTGDVPEGIMFEVWQHVAAQLEWSYTVEWVDSLDELAEALIAGDVDIAVAPLSSTSERENRFDFSTPVVASGPVFGVHQRTENPVTLASALFSRDTLRLLMWSALGLIVLGHLMWAAERRNPDSDLSSGYVHGVWDGTWWATVTVTTVGYGDTSPKTGAGRMVAILAMAGSLFMVGAFVSEVTRALQSGRAETVVADIGDLDGRPVGVVDASSYQAYLDERGVDTVAYPSQTEAFEAAEAGELDIVVADRYTLASLGSSYGLRSTADPLYDEFVAFGMQENSPLRSDVNAVLSDLHRNGVVRDIIDRWTN